MLNIFQVIYPIEEKIRNLRSTDGSKKERSREVRPDNSEVSTGTSHDRLAKPRFQNHGILEDGRPDMDSNTIEYKIRLLAIRRRIFFRKFIKGVGWTDTGQILLK